MPMSPADFKFVSDLMRQESAVLLEPGKEYLVETRLAPVARQSGLASVVELVEQLKRAADAVLKNAVVDALTTNETSFFRDFQPFEAFKKNVVPLLMAKRKAEKRLSIWSAAASTGQEPYSIAMILKESFPELASWNVSLYATDLCSAALERAKSGAYSQLEVNRGLPAPLLVKYFKKQGNEWRISDDLKKIVTFAQLNLIKPWSGIGPFDVVFIRNVLIYFDLETKQEILAKIRKVMAPDGYLILGSAETTLNIDSNFERSPFERGSCYQLKAR